MSDRKSWAELILGRNSYLGGTHTWAELISADQSAPVAEAPEFEPGGRWPASGPSQVVLVRNRGLLRGRFRPIQCVLPTGSCPFGPECGRGGGASPDRIGIGHSPPIKLHTWERRILRYELTDHDGCHQASAGLWVDLPQMRHQGAKASRGFSNFHVTGRSARTGLQLGKRKTPSKPSPATIPLAE
jgi:hypothetical protein